MTADPNADLVEMLRAAYPHLATSELEWAVRREAPAPLSGAQQRAILAWANARRDAAVEEKDAAISSLQISLQDAIIVTHEYRAEIARLRSALKGLVKDVDCLTGESEGVYGLHLNGDPAPWNEPLSGGEFERLESLEIARAALEPKPPEPSR